MTIKHMFCLSLDIHEEALEITCSLKVRLPPRITPRSLTVFTGVSPFLSKDKKKLFRGHLSATKDHGFSSRRI